MRCQSLGADLVVPISGLVIYPEDSEVGLSGPTCMDAISLLGTRKSSTKRRILGKMNSSRGVPSMCGSVPHGNKKTSRWAKPAESPLPLPVGPDPPRCSSRFARQWVFALPYPSVCLTNGNRCKLRARSICDDEKLFQIGLLSMWIFRCLQLIWREFFPTTPFRVG